MYDVLPVLAIVLITFSSVVAAAIGGCMAGTLYGKPYWDRSERTGSRKSDAFRSMRLWPWLCRYFAMQVDVHPCLKDVSGRVLFVQYPHGFSPLPFISLLLAPLTPTLERLFAHVYFAGASAIAWVPGLRDWCLAGGYVDVGREALHEFCAEQPGASLVISPGGMREMARARYGYDDLYVGHTGFVDLAMEERFKYIVPVFVERQTDAFFCGRWLLRARDWTLTHIGVPLPSFVIPIPLPTCATVHFGKPVRVGASADRSVVAHGVGASLAKCIASTKSPERVRVWTTHVHSVVLADPGFKSALCEAMVRRPRQNSTCKTD